jgi:hypothetical protein
LIVHLWFTFSTGEVDYLRTTRLKIYWDGRNEPAVDVPIGDFHGLGHGVVRQFSSSLIEVEARRDTKPYDDNTYSQALQQRRSPLATLISRPASKPTRALKNISTTSLTE